MQREPQISNLEVENGLNEIISSNSGKMTPFMKISW